MESPRGIHGVPVPQGSPGSPEGPCLLSLDSKVHVCDVGWWESSGNSRNVMLHDLLRNVEHQYETHIAKAKWIHVCTPDKSNALGLQDGTRNRQVLAKHAILPVIYPVQQQVGALNRLSNRYENMVKATMLSNRLENIVGYRNMSPKTDRPPPQPRLFFYRDRTITLKTNIRPFVFFYWDRIRFFIATGICHWTRA